MDKSNHSLTSKDISHVDGAYSESFNDLLRNIIAGYADQPEKIGEAFAQFLLHCDLGTTIIKKAYRESIPFETDMMITTFFREIVCFRFLQDWTLGNEKTQEEKDLLTEKFRRLAELDYAHNWATKLADGFWEYVKKFYESHNQVQSKYFVLLKERERRV